MERDQQVNPTCLRFAPFPVYFQPEKSLWRYFIFNSDIFGCDWRKVDGEDDAYEMVIVRKDKTPGLQGFFYTFPDANEYSTKDLYRPHPTLPDHWMYLGRIDDVIVFSNGEKLNPVTIEDMVQGHDDIKSALVVGANRFQPGLILEPHRPVESDEEANQLIESVWPVVVEANKVTVAHGRIARELVTLSDPEKPFHRAGKGTIQRAATVRLYKDDIDRLYEKADQLLGYEAVELDISSEDALANSVQQLIAKTADLPSLKEDDDFFNVGVDSLQIINASRLLRVSLEAAGVHLDESVISAREIYGHPTSRKLANYVLSLIALDGKKPQNVEEQQSEAAQDLVHKYIRDFPAIREPPSDEGQTILVTGTTGALGSYLLDFLSSTPAVKKIVALNRAESGLEKQTKSSSERGLSTNFHKVEFLHADLSQAYLGLDKAVYERLQGEVDRIIHNQWPVNFNISVESFEPHIRGVRHLVDFSSGSIKQIPVIFISSIGTADTWSKPYQVPEESIDDFTISSTGYGKSKLVSSLILEEAAKRSGVPTEIIRVGQIAGPQGEKGVWNKQEWLPSIIASSTYLGILPEEMGPMSRIDWTPIEGIASLVLEVAGITTRVPISDIKGYFHGVNPQVTSWEALAPAVKDFYGDRIQRLVPFGEWLDALEESQAKTSDIEKNPAVKLLDTYRAIRTAAAVGQRHPGFAMERTMQRSKTMRDMKAITPDLMKLWCKQWNF